MSGDSKTVLETSDLSVTYGNVRANSNICLRVGEGEIVGLIGANGAGKTTLVDAICGFTPYVGQVVLDGVPLNGLGPHARRWAGLSRTWQAGELFDDLTVGQNVLVASERLGWRSAIEGVFRPRRGANYDIRTALEVVGLQDFSSHLPGRLSLGQQKLVGVARAVAHGTKVVALDEPAAGLDTDESAEFGEDVRRIRDSGISVLLIEHDTTLVMSVCDRAYVLDFGMMIAEGSPQEISKNPAVLAAYLGEVGA
jgi:ABC-type branched-subunit amino acid transport system ATPase component